MLTGSIPVWKTHRKYRTDELVSDDIQQSTEATSDVLGMLRLEHTYISSLLSLVRSELDRIADPSELNHRLVEDVLIYLMEYPDQFHHPLEDVLFERVVERSESSSGLAEHLTRDHTISREKGLELIAMLEEEEKNHGQLVALIDDYITKMSAHLNTEEALFDQAENLLSRQDWTDVAESLERESDPLFGQQVEQQHRELYEYMTIPAEGRTYVDSLVELVASAEQNALNMTRSMLDAQIQIVKMTMDISTAWFRPRS